MGNCLIAVCATLLIATERLLVTAKDTELAVHLPPFEAPADDSYLCVGVDVPADAHSIIRITPEATQEVVHHMLLFGCRTPVKPPGEVYFCKHHGVCKDQELVFYGWGKNAPPFVLPEGSGIPVGLGSAVPRIVLQVHYLTGRPNGDSSGVSLTFVSEPKEESVSIVHFAPFFSIPPRRREYKVSISCCYDGIEALHPLAFRVHAHSLGRRISLDMGTDPLPKATDKQMQLAVRDPQLPQLFSPVDEGTSDIVPGSWLTATCTFDSSERNRTTWAGPDHTDEMCNMYLMVRARTSQHIACWRGDGVPNMPPPPPSVARAFPFPNFAWGSGATVGMGPISGIAVDPLDNSLWLLVRRHHAWDVSTFRPDNTVANRTKLTSKAVFNVDAASGQIRRAWGDDTFVMPHGITVGFDGSIWITDAGLHQVFKFTRQGEKLLELGEAYVPGSDTKHFCKPTGVAVLRNGDALVSDGYCNSRVLRVKGAAGAKRGTGRAVVSEVRLPGVANVSVMHSVTVSACRGVAYIPDRERGRIFAVSLATWDNTKPEVDTAPLMNARKAIKANFRVWAARVGPRGEIYSLLQAGSWEKGEVWLVGESHPIHSRLETFTVKLEGVRYPHDFAFGVLPKPFFDSEAPLVVYVSETPPAGERATLHRFVLARDGWSRSARASPAEAHPGLVPGGLGALGAPPAAAVPAEVAKGGLETLGSPAMAARASARAGEGGERSEGGADVPFEEIDEAAGPGIESPQAAMQLPPLSLRPEAAQSDDVDGLSDEDAPVALERTHEDGSEHEHEHIYQLGPLSLQTVEVANLESGALPESQESEREWERHRAMQSLGIGLVATIALASAATLVYRGARVQVPQSEARYA